jgi:hypothetical protein
MKPTQPVIPAENVGDLLAGMARTGFQGQRLEESVEVWAGMIRDPECTIFLGLSGARIPAGMQTLDPEGLNTGECPCGGEAGEPPKSTSVRRPALLLRNFDSQRISIPPTP